MNDFPVVGSLEASDAHRVEVLRATVHFRIYDTAEAGSHWRLLSGNHRELGRAAQPLRSVQEATRDIAATVQRLAGADVVVRPDTSRRWEWRLVDAAGIVAVSGHGFDRKLRCEQAARQFLALAPGAAIAPHVITSGMRRGNRPRMVALGTT